MKFGLRSVAFMAKPAMAMRLAFSLQGIVVRVISTFITHHA
jgi:hypothetical protein